MTMMLGSIPQQDVFQRVTSARTATIAIYARSSAAALFLLHLRADVHRLFGDADRPRQFNA
jgi:hypothetical protein